MLRELKVQDFALIEGVSVRFEAGFNVLTGETGAGKSLLVDALGLATGGRASAELVRSGAKEAVVEALFEPSRDDERASLDEALGDRGLPVADGVMVVRRLIDAKGRHRVYVNGGLATVATLADICSKLVAVAGQHEHVSLAKSREALALLDDFASATSGDFDDERARYESAWSALQHAREALELLDDDPESRSEREAFLRFQLSELEALSPRPDELEELEAERRLLSGAERLREITAEAESTLYSADDSMAAVLSRLLRRMEDAVAIDPSLEEHAESIESAMAILSDAGRDLGEHARRVEADPHKMEKVESRLSALRRLARRHGGDLAAACVAAESLREQLDALESHEIRWEEARRALEDAEAKATLAAKKLTRERKAAASLLDERVLEGLERLGMKGSRVALRLFEADLGPLGADRVEVGLATDPGEPLRPISKVASGGELSRLLLAFRRAVGQVDGVATAVFDEVDAGIGGAVAEAAGRLMAEVAKSRQVLSVTHLPQLAVQAEHHLVVTKEIADGRARIDVSPVSGPQRVEEVARMLGGARVTASTRRHAKEMLSAAGRAAPSRGSTGGSRGSGRDDAGSRARSDNGVVSV